MARIVFYFSAVFLMVLSAFIIGFESAGERKFLYRPVVALFAAYREITGGHRDRLAGFLQPSRRDGDGVTVNLHQDGALILLTGFFEDGNQLRLIERDGTVLAKWPVSFTELVPDTGHLAGRPVNDFRVDLHGSVIEPDGSVVFNFEYGATVKLDRCGHRLWTLPRKTHHSIAPAASGGYWIPAQNVHPFRPSPGMPPFTSLDREGPYREDVALHVSEQGQVLEEIPVARLLLNGPLFPLLTATGNVFYRGDGISIDREIIHLNAVREVSESDSVRNGLFEPGDLMLSLRNYNLVAVIDPHDGTVRWHSTGPWIRQHDPKLNPDGTITVFNNNAFHIGLDRELRASPDSAPAANIMKIDPASGQWQVIYGDKPGQEMTSEIRGKHQLLPGGGYLITESLTGRVFEIDREGAVVWEYINRYDAENLAEVNGAELYPRSFFSVTSWVCN